MEKPTTVLHAACRSSSMTQRSIAMQVSNKTKYAWESPRVYFRWGTADNGLPGQVESGEDLLFTARRTRGPLPVGSVGVITYYVPKQNLTVALLWSLPLNYLLFSNTWNVAILDGNQPASASLYDTQLYSKAHQGDANHYNGTGAGDWNYEGSMGHSASPSLAVSVFCT